MSDIKKAYLSFCAEYTILPSSYGGIYELHHEELKKQEKASFDIFSQSPLFLPRFWRQAYQYGFIGEGTETL